MPDPLQFATPQEQGQLRSRLFATDAARIPLTTADPTTAAVQAFRTATATTPLTATSPLAGQVQAFRRLAGQIEAQAGQDVDDLRRKAAAYVAGRRVAAEQDDVEQREAAEQAAAAQQAAQGGLTQTAISGVRNLLGLLDGPRRWSFETLVLPAAQKLGMQVPEEPEGRELFLRGLGGEQMTDWLRDRTRSLGFAESTADLAAKRIVPAVAGFALDVLFDPLTYLSFGTGGVMKAGGRVLTQGAGGGAELLGALRSAPTVGALGADSVRLLKTQDSVSRLSAYVRALSGGGTVPAAATAAQEVVRALDAARAGGRLGALTAADVQAAALGAVGTRQKALRDAITATLDPLAAAGANAEDAAEALLSVLLQKVPKGTPGGTRAVQAQIDVAGGYLKAATTPTREPVIDAAFAHLRDIALEEPASGYGALFKPGGARFVLPGKVGLHVPLLNKEERLGLILGGRELSLPQANVLDGLRRQALNLGQAALAHVPVDAALSPVKRLFVPYAWLHRPAASVLGADDPFQHAGGAELIERLKSLHKMPNSVREQTARELSTLYKGVTPEQRAQIHYLFDLGVADGTETLDEFATRVNAYTASLGGKSVIEGADVKERLLAQADALEEYRRQMADVGLRREIDPADLPAGFRDASLAITRAMPAAQVIERLIARAKTAAESGTIVRRLAPHELMADRARFERLFPDDHVRTLIERMVHLETDLWGNPLVGAGPGRGGPVAAITRFSQEFGQEGYLPNYLRHIHAPASTATMRHAGRQVNKRPPRNIGKARVTSFQAEPEELAALGILTDPEAVMNQTLAQYRVVARQSQFVDWVLHNYGRKVASDADIDKTVEQAFDPEAVLSRYRPAPDELAEKLRLFRANADLSPEELAALPWHETKKGGAGTWVLPKDVYQGLAVADAVTQNVGGLLVALDKTLALQRALATVIHPGYHVRNLLGNIINSQLGGVSIMDTVSTADAMELVLGTADGTLSPLLGDKLAQAVGRASAHAIGALGEGVRVMGRTTGLDPMADALRPANLPTALAARQPNLASTGSMTNFDPRSPDALEWVRRYLEERGVLRTGQTAIDTSAELGKLPPKLVDAMGTLTLIKAGRTSSEMVDNIMRVRHVLGRIAQGDSLEEAVLSAKKFLFDYTDLTDIEKGVFRRTAFFYTWTRKNIPLQVEMLLREPKQVAYWNALFRNLSDPDAQATAEAALMPAWMREQLGIVLGRTGEGQLTVLTGLGLPIEDLNLFFSTKGASRIVQKFVDLGNPIARWLLDSTGKPTGFTGMPVDDPALSNYYRRVFPLYAEIAQTVPGLADWLELDAREIVDARGEKQTLYTMNPWKTYLLYNVFAMGRSLREAGEISYAIEGKPGDTEAERKARQLITAVGFATGAQTSSLDLSRPLEALHTSTTSIALDEEIGGKLDGVARQLASGQLPASTWRERRHELMSERANRRTQLLEAQLAQEAGNIPEDQQAVASTFRASFVTRGQQLVDTILSLSPSGPNPLSPQGLPFTSTTEYAKTREALLTELRETYPDAAKRYDALRAQMLERLPPAAREMERAYQQAVELLDRYEEVPKYRNLTPAQEAQADAALDALRNLSGQYGPARAKRLLRQTDPDGFRLLQRAVPNTKARQRAWRQLNDRHGQLLNFFFRDLPLNESLAAIAEAPVAGGADAPDVAA